MKRTMHKQVQTWDVFETRFRTTQDINKRYRLVKNIKEFCKTLGISESRADFDEHNNALLRFAMPTDEVTKRKELLQQVTNFFKKAADIMDVTCAGQVIGSPDVTQSIQREAA